MIYFKNSRERFFKILLSTNFLLFISAKEDHCQNDRFKIRLETPGIANIVLIKQITL